MTKWPQSAAIVISEGSATFHYCSLFMAGGFCCQCCSCPDTCCLLSVLFLPRYLLLWLWPLMSWVLTIHILNLWMLSNLSLLQLVHGRWFLLSVLFSPRYLLIWPWPLMSWVLTIHIHISLPHSRSLFCDQPGHCYCCCQQLLMSTSLNRLMDANPAEGKFKCIIKNG